MTLSITKTKGSDCDPDRCSMTVANNVVKCTVDNCQNVIFTGNDKCALHCEKIDYQSNKRIGLLTEFHDFFAKYVSDELFNPEHETPSTFSKEDFDIFCKQGSCDDEIIVNTLKNEYLLAHKIVFPARDERDFFDYLKLLKLFKEINFNYCEFNCTDLALGDVEVFFQDCKFHSSWSLYDYKQLSNVDGVNYQNCEFCENVSAYTPDEGRAKLSFQQFDFACEFHKKLSLVNADIDGSLFSSKQISENYDLEIKQLELEDIRIFDKFIINNLKSDKVAFKDVEFNGKFECKNSTIAHLEIDNTNFDKVADFFSSYFIVFKIYKSIFNKFVGFEKCKFGLKNEVKYKHLCNFKFTTFFDFASFRKAKFYSGLKLSEANFRSPPNFYDSFISYTLTNRETYRIIKHSFDSVGNKLEANKYYSLELKKYKDDLYSKKTIVKNKLNRSSLCRQRIVFEVNNFGSSFGQNFTRPLFIIFVAMLSFMALAYGQKENWLYKIMPHYNEKITCFVSLTNSLAKALIPFNSLQKEGMEMLSLIFGVFFSVMIWLTITAIKMHTRR